jgi:hypothetical protein
MSAANQLPATGPAIGGNGGWGRCDPMRLPSDYSDAEVRGGCGSGRRNYTNAIGSLTARYCGHPSASPAYGAIRTSARKPVDLLDPIYNWFTEGFDHADHPRLD